MKWRSNTLKTEYSTAKVRPVALVVKIGSSSLSDARGHLRQGVIEKLAGEVAALRAAGRQVLIVTSGAIGAGLPALGFDQERPRDFRTLQAAAAVGQTRLMAGYEQALDVHDLVAAQVLLAPSDFFERSRYLHARGTLQRLLELGAVPVINENDAVADDAIRFGDNDRIAALVAHLVGAERLVLLTDTPGLFSEDPRNNPDAALIDEIASVTEDITAHLGGAGTKVGSGGMASKVAAARMAAFSGVTTVIADAGRADVLHDAVAETAGVGTIVRPQPRPMPAKKLWIAFALTPVGALHIDQGARSAIEGSGRSLLAVGVTKMEGTFERGDPVELIGPDGDSFARGLAAVSATELRAIVGTRSGDHPPGTPDEVVHRDELALIT